MKTGISSAYMSHLAQVQTATFKYLRLLFSVTKAIMRLEVLLEAQLCSWSVTTSDQFVYMWSIVFIFFYFFTWVITLLSHSFFFFFCSSWKSFLLWVFLTSTRIFWRLCLKCKLTQKYRYWNKRESCLTHVKINKRFVTPYVRVLYTCLYTCL